MHSLTWVREHMPEESTLALAKFTSINRRYQGAGWDDCLDVLLDSDSHINVTEPLFDALQDVQVSPMLPSAIAITLLYASQAFAEATPEHQASMVRAMLLRNGVTNHG